MGFRFQKRISISKYLRLNFSKTGASISIGKRGLDLNIKGDQVMGNIGLPGTGLSYREKLTPKAGEPSTPSEQTITQEPNRPNRALILIVCFILFALFYGFLKMAGE
ncbi:hypothetical protein A8O14_02695 [Polynucleobacter wuianus]|uniref:DUF4236 domain-containing protein n=1 Tax=Polynucleobacter wuianus TaxID=1743168 RepID=A0A191UDX6_9BURK|nr:MULTISPECIES: DUF4236 domain-containing protein [Polynucleobacter]ANI99095.1 hypothetical protein A8O14_02695 [Polynucleobacter wuianus]MBU3552332.1 DUF4236 domain-containing protein [Polynucleobacter sp. MWH-Post4-6-1]